MLYRQPSSKDRARKSWKAILGLQYFGPAKVVKKRVSRGRAADFVGTSQEKAAHGHVAYAVQEVSTASKGAQNGTLCPGNERCAVDKVFCILHEVLSLSFLTNSCMLGGSKRF
jgi:hypothetical protein